MCGEQITHGETRRQRQTTAFFSIAPGISSRVKIEQEQAFGGDFPFKKKKIITVRLPGLGGGGFVSS